MAILCARHYSDYLTINRNPPLNQHFRPSFRTVSQFCNTHHMSLFQIGNKLMTGGTNDHKTPQSKETEFPNLPTFDFEMLYSKSWDMITYRPKQNFWNQSSNFLKSKSTFHQKQNSWKCSSKDYDVCSQLPFLHMKKSMCIAVQLNKFFFHYSQLHNERLLEKSQNPREIRTCSLPIARHKCWPVP